MLLQHQMAQQQLAQQQQQTLSSQQAIQQVQPVHETVAEEHTSQLAHLKGSGEVHGVETQVNEEELVRAVEVTHSHPLAQKIQQQLIHPSNEGAEGAVSVETQFSRAEREKVSVSPHPVCPHPLACTLASPPVLPIAPLVLTPGPDPPCRPDWDSEFGREGSRRGSLPVPVPPYLHTPPTPPSAPALLAASHRLPFPSQITRRRSADPSELCRARQSLSARLTSGNISPYSHLWEEQLPMIEVRRASGGTGAALSPLWEQQSLAPLTGSLLPMFTIREARAWSLSQSSLASGQVL